MTLNDLSYWHEREAKACRSCSIPISQIAALWHEEAVICLDYAIKAWDRLASIEEREACRDARDTEAADRIEATGLRGDGHLAGYAQRNARWRGGRS